ncbi:ABC transporter ATP-binding protein [Methylobacterium sp. JK268]
MAPRSDDRAGATRRVLLFLARRWGERLRLVASITAVMTAATVADVLLPVYAGRVIGDLAGPDRAAALDGAIRALAAMAALGAVTVGLRQAGLALIVRLTLAMMSDIARDAFHRVQRLSTDWHAGTFSGSTVRKISRGMWAVDGLNDIVLLAMVPTLVAMAGTASVLGWAWPAMGALVGGMTALFIGVSVLLAARVSQPAAALSNALDSQLGGVMADAIGNNAVVKAFGAEAREDARLARTLGKWRKRTRRTWSIAVWSGTLRNVMLLVFRTALIGLALWFWWRGEASPGEVATVLTSYFVLHGYLREVGFHITHLQRALGEMEELVALDAESIGVADAPEAAPLRVTGGAIRFEAVTFHYAGHAAPLYRDLSVEIPAGERVGLVGRSGSGKTTFVKLIQRLHDVTGGRVLIDGQDVARVTQASLRAQVAIVPQEPSLFHRTLAENIAYGRPGAAMAEIERAARLANAHDFIARLPKGYATLVGERGVKLSGGERQRVALARAFLADAPILILDEATASLDSESEALIQEATERLMRGRTAIVIAHRLSTVRSLDRILVFERGRIVEDGPHDALVRRPDGAYRALFERQAMADPVG